MRISTFSIILLTVAILSSCGSSKNYSYLQDMSSGKGYIINYKHESIIHVDDRINIIVSSKNPELAIPFNMPGGGSVQVLGDGNVSSSNNKSASETKGYRVDSEGNIDFPILGRLHVETLTLSQLTEMIKNKIVDGNYIKDPIVTAEFTNFKFFALGEVNNRGEHRVDGSSVSLLEALSIAGDLTLNGRSDRVAVIREDAGSSLLYMLDLRSKNIFNSPGYYLKQNDIVYVEAKPEKKDIEEKMIRYFSLVLSTAATGISLYVLLKK